MKQEHILELIKAVSASNLQTFKYEESETKLVLSKQKGSQVSVSGAEAVPVEAVPVVAPESVAEVSGKVVTSPLVGTFYAAPGEEEPPFVKVGDTVNKGQTLAIVEAMKLMNEIESDYQGVVAEVLVENGEMVEYGQPLFRIS